MSDNFVKSYELLYNEYLNNFTLNEQRNGWYASPAAAKPVRDLKLSLTFDCNNNSL